MKNLSKVWGITLFSLLSIFYSCSNEEVQHILSPESISVGNSKDALNFCAEYSPQQKENLIISGCVFLPQQQKDSWNNIISGDIPVSWGIFDSPIKSQTRAAGIGGAYPAQYWTMIRLKTGSISARMKKAINKSVNIIESKTNVRFHNSQKDPEFYEPYHINYRMFIYPIRPTIMKGVVVLV